MKSLFILRHAKSSWAQPGLSDIERPLNKRGIAQVVNLNKWWKRQTTLPGNILCSPATRTQETYRGLQSALAEASLEISPPLYNGMVDTYLEALWTQDAETVLLIGHNPTCDELTRYLTKPSSPAAEKLMAHHFGTATMAVFEFDVDKWSDISQASGLLTEFVRPRDLEDTTID